MIFIVKNVWKKIRQALENLVGLEEVHFDLGEKTIKIEGEADPVAIEKNIQEVRDTPCSTAEGK